MMLRDGILIWIGRVVFFGLASLGAIYVIGAILRTAWQAIKDWLDKQEEEANR